MLLGFEQPYILVWCDVGSALQGGGMQLPMEELAR